THDSVRVLTRGPPDRSADRRQPVRRGHGSDDWPCLPTGHGLASTKTADRGGGERMTLPLEWFHAEALRQGLPLDRQDLQAIAAFVNEAREALDRHRPRETEGLEPTGQPTDEDHSASDGGETNQVSL